MNRSAAERYNRLTHAIHDLLPRWLAWVPATWFGWAILSLTTFGLDIGLLSFQVHVLGVWYPVAVSIGFGIAAVVNFLLNRWLNFRAHGDFGKQSGKQFLVVSSNYLLWVLGFSSLLRWLGTPAEIARLAAACVEGLYLYLLMRFWVFPTAGRVVDAGGALVTDRPDRAE